MILRSCEVGVKKRFEIKIKPAKTFYKNVIPVTMITKTIAGVFAHVSARLLAVDGWKTSDVAAHNVPEQLRYVVPQQTNEHETRQKGTLIKFIWGGKLCDSLYTVISV